MKFLAFFTLFFVNAILAAVYQHTDKPEVSVNPPVLASEIPVTQSPSSELSLLNQLQLKTQSTDENQQYTWNRVRQCEGCHAYNMYAGNSYLPILQGQNQEYLYSKLLMFKNNRLIFHPLGAYLEQLSSKELMGISSFYADQFSDLKRSLVPVNFPKVNEHEHEEVVSVKVCAECHGVEGNGGQLIPVISGQNKNYLSYRIREIADNSSRIHFVSEAPVSCKLKGINIRQSRQLASLLSVVVDNRRVEHGKQVYRVKCAQCHDAGNADNPSQRQADNWSKHLLKGTRMLIHDTLLANQHEFVRGRHYSFSQNEMEDAIHYMIYQLRQSL